MSIPAQAVPGRRLAWLRLLRVSNAPSPVADVLASAAVAAALTHRDFDAARVALAAAASACVYHAGMAMNDVADRVEDAATRPHRPIPSGAVSVGAASTCSALLVAASLLLSLLAGAPLVGAALAAIVVLYDFAAPRGSWIGPVLLGAARGVNALLGAVAVAPFTEQHAWTYGLAAAYGMYIFSVSVAAIAEDRPWSGARAALAAVSAAAALGAAAWFLRSAFGASFGVLLPCAVVEPLSIVLGPARPWTPDRVGQLVGASLRATMLIQAIVSAAAGRADLALICIIGFVAARVLSRWIPPT